MTSTFRISRRILEEVRLAASDDRPLTEAACEWLLVERKINVRIQISGSNNNNVCLIWLFCFCLCIAGSA